MIDIRLPHRFKPREYQKPVIRALEAGCKRLITVWHRRAGKDKTWVNATVRQMVQRVGSYYHVFPTFKQGKKILWEGIDADGMRVTDHFPPEIVKRTNDTDLLIEFKNGSVWQIVGSDTADGDALVGTNPIGIVFSEWSIQSPALWNKLRPILSENGGWAGFAYTPRGHNHGHDLFKMAQKDPDWFAQLLTISDTTRGPDEARFPGGPVITEEAYQDEIRQGMDPDLAAQEYYCSFEGPQEGSYYGKWLMKLKSEGQVCSVPYDPRLLVHTFWDLGVDDATAIWFMQALRDTEFRFIDYYENTGHGLQHYVNQLRQREWVYGTHYLPHDVGVRELGDKAARSRLEIMRSLGVSNIQPGNLISVKDGIDAARTLIPLCWFDEKRTGLGFNALMSYKRFYDSKVKKFKDKPLHDWASHAADAFREFAVTYQFPRVSKPSREREYTPGGWMRIITWILIGGFYETALQWLAKSSAC